MARPKKKEDDKAPRKTHSFRLHDELVDIIRRLGKRHDRTLSGEVQHALKKYAAENGKPWSDPDDPE